MELNDLVKGIDGLLVLNNQVFAYTHFAHIRICHVHDGNIWITLNFSVINDIRRLCKLFDQLKIDFYYTSAGINFNDDPLSRKSISLLTENIINILCIEKVFYSSYHSDVVNDINLYKKFLDMCIKFNKASYAIEAIDELLHVDSEIKSSLIRIRVRHRPFLTLENINDLKVIRRPLVIQSILL